MSKFYGKEKRNNVPAEITMTLESAIASKSNLVNLDTHNIFGNTGQLPTVPHNSSNN